MSHAAPIRAIILAVALSLGDLIVTTPADANSIVSVDVQPAGVLSPVDEVSLEILIGTTSNPAFLLAPTDLLRSEDQISIDIFVDAGPAATFDSLIESVILGAFEPGTYSFAVRIHRSFLPLPSPEDEFLGSFTVVPEPASLTLLISSMAALLLRRRARRML